MSAAKQRASGLRFGDPRVLAVLSALVLFRLLPRGFSNRELREQVAPLLGLHPQRFTQGKMTYELRRLRLHGLIERLPKTHRYRVTDLGLRAALFLSRSYLRLIRPGLAALTTNKPACTTSIQRAIERFDDAVLRSWTHQTVAL